MIVTVLLAAIVLLLALMGVMFWVLIAITKRNQRLEWDLEDRDRQAFHDLKAMFAYQEKLDGKDLYIGALLDDLDNAHTSLELVLQENQRLERTFEANLEMVLRG